MICLLLSMLLASEEPCEICMLDAKELAQCELFDEFLDFKATETTTATTEPEPSILRPIVKYFEEADDQEYIPELDMYDPAYDLTLDDDGGIYYIDGEPLCMVPIEKTCDMTSSSAAPTK